MKQASRVVEGETKATGTRPWRILRREGGTLICAVPEKDETKLLVASDIIAEVETLRAEVERAKVHLRKLAGHLRWEHRGPHYTDPFVTCGGPGVCETLIDIEAAQASLHPKEGLARREARP